MKHAAVMAGLVPTGGGFLFQHGHMRAGIFAQQLARGGEAYDAAADDETGWGAQLMPP